MKSPSAPRTIGARRSALRAWLYRLLRILGDRPVEEHPDLLDLWIARKRFRSLWG